LVGTKSNFEVLLEGMPEDEVATGEVEDDMVLTIKQLKLQHTTVNIISDKIGERSFQMDDFVINNLEGNADQLSEEITNRLINHVSEQVKAFAILEVTKLVKQKAISMAKEKVSEEITEKLQDKLKGSLGDKVKKLNFKFN